MPYFKSKKGLVEAYPKLSKLVANIKEEYPEAKLVLSKDKVFDNGLVDINMVYDIGSEIDYLWVWVSNHVDDLKFFEIDEMFELPKEQALVSIDNSW